jgi:hypothetical protein
MWMAEVLIVVDRRNADRNALADIAAAVADAGGYLLDTDESNHVLTANVPASAIPDIAAMEGVAYVRPVLNYFRTAAAG